MMCCIRHVGFDLAKEVLIKYDVLFAIFEEVLIKYDAQLFIREMVLFKIAEIMKESCLAWRTCEL